MEKQENGRRKGEVMSVRVMIADDESMIRLLVRDIIETYVSGVTVVGEAADGDECLDLFQKLNPQIIITDVVMPHTDGLELLRQIKAISPEVLIILLSAHKKFEYVHEAIKEQAFDYLLKPTREEDIKRVFGRALKVLEEKEKNKALYSEMKRNIERFEHAAAGVEAGKISGAVGNFANIPPFVEKYVCDKLGIRAQEISTQVLPRDLHAEYFAVLASIATSIERMATEIRGLQKSEQREVEEFFAKGQKGSSAMPHKRNPIGSENMTGLARVIRGHMVTAYENVALWHERDISHSSAERIIAPDTTILIDYMLNRFGNIVKNLTVFPENMIRNMNSTFGLIFSQRAMLTLIEKGMTREQAYDLVQPKTAQSWDNQVDFKPLLESDPEVTSRLTQEEIDEIFNPVYYTKRVDEIFERIGLGD